MKDKALELLEEIESNVSVCCAITMEPDMVLDLIEQLRERNRENVEKIWLLKDGFVYLPCK